MILNWWSVITIFIIRLLAPAIAYSYTTLPYMMFTIQNEIINIWYFLYIYIRSFWNINRHIYIQQIFWCIFCLPKIDLSIRSSRNLLAAMTFLNNYCLSSKLFAYDKYVMLIHKCSFDVFYDGFFLPHILSIYCWQDSKCSRNNQDWYFHLWYLSKTIYYLKFQLFKHQVIAIYNYVFVLWIGYHLLWQFQIFDAELLM